MDDNFFVKNMYHTCPAPPPTHKHRSKRVLRIFFSSFRHLKLRFAIGRKSKLPNRHKNFQTFMVS